MKDLEKVEEELFQKAVKVPAPLVGEVKLRCENVGVITLDSVLVTNLLNEKDALEAKNADACKMIADLLVQVESLQIANRNLCTGDDSLRERFQNLQEANKYLVIQKDTQVDTNRVLLQHRDELKNASLKDQATIQTQQKKIEKLKKKNKLLLRALSC